MNINKEVLIFCKEKNIKQDQLGSILFVLECMYYENIELLDLYDDSTSNKNALLIYKECEKHGLLKKDTSLDKKVHYKLSYDGKVFFELLLEYGVNINIKPVDSEALKDWISDWVNLWRNPNNGHFYKQGTRSLGINDRDAFDRMNSFIVRYDSLFKGRSKKEVIMEATKNYIDNYKKNSFVFCKNAPYFIMKQEGNSKGTIHSVLAEWCENYINGIQENIKEKKTFGRSLNEE